MKKILPVSIKLSVNKAVNNPQGFTLIELLAVVVIISILSVIGATVYTSTQKSARDGRRRADIQALAQALEISRTPGLPTYGTIVTASAFASGLSPTDPLGAGNSWTEYYYIYTTGTAKPTFIDTVSATTGCTSWVPGTGPNPSCFGTASQGTSMVPTAVASSFTGVTSVTYWEVCTVLENGSTYTNSTTAFSPTKIFCIPSQQ